MIHVSFEQADVNNSSRFRDRDGWVKISSDALDSATISPSIRTDAGDWFWSGSGGWDLDKSRPELKMTKWWYLSCKLLMSGLLMDCSCEVWGGGGRKRGWTMQDVSCHLRKRNALSCCFLYILLLFLMTIHLNQAMPAGLLAITEPSLHYHLLRAITFRVFKGCCFG